LQSSRFGAIIIEDKLFLKGEPRGSLFCIVRKIAKERFREGEPMASKITDRIAAYMEEFPKDEGLSLYHCEFVKEGPDRYLRIYIDVDEEGRYVSTDDCEKVSKFLEEKLDADDPIEGTYVLEVSYPGMDRPLITDAHYEKYQGELVDVRLYKPYEGEKLLTGTLEGKTDEELKIRLEGHDEVTILPLKEVAKVQLAVVL